MAAQDNMGVLVWLLGDGRGVPKNFKHVIPNYSLVNWTLSGTAPYRSYHALITDAVDDAGGQGFATDYAGYMPDLTEQLSTSKSWVDLLEDIEPSTDANFISLVWNELDPLVQSVIRAELPTSDTFVYRSPTDMLEVFTEEQLRKARMTLVTVIQDQVIAPLDNSIDILDDNRYLTRLYTTLSADEMDVNPEFTFNTAMPDQALTRNATFTQACIDDTNYMTLTLGTGRDGEVVLDSWQGWPTGPAIQGVQKASRKVEKTSATADPVLLAENKFEMLTLYNAPDGVGTSTSSGGDTTSSGSSSGTSGSSSGDTTSNSSSSDSSKW